MCVHPLVWVMGHSIHSYLPTLISYKGGVSRFKNLINTTKPQSKSRQCKIIGTMSALIDLALVNICGTCMLGETKSSFNYQDLLALIHSQRGECVVVGSVPKTWINQPQNTQSYYCSISNYQGTLVAFFLLHKHISLTLTSQSRKGSEILSSITWSIQFQTLEISKRISKILGLYKIPNIIDIII